MKILITIVAVVMFSYEGFFCYSIPGIVSFVIKDDNCMRYDGNTARVCNDQEMFTMNKVRLVK